MSQETSENLRNTPLSHIHEELGGKLVPFAGWNMPIQFEGVIPEHLCVRDGVGVFDVSHMGEIEIKGKDAEKLLQWVLTNDVEKMADQSILYSLMCYENGGVVDDLLVHRYSQDHYFLCVNASNSEKDFKWIAEKAESFDTHVRDISAETAQLAIQGKHSQALLQKLCDVSLDDLEYYHFQTGKIHSVDGIISRTGYTGEDGFEVYLPTAAAEAVYRKILDEGVSFGLKPIGLGARDTLRLEMGYALYGHEIDAGSLPLEAGLGWVVKLKKDDFVGKEAIKNQKDIGPSRRLVGIRLLGRGVPREGYRVLRLGQPVGKVTSGTFSPSLNVGIGLCYVSCEHSEIGTRLELEIRSRIFPTEVVKPPFVPSRVKK